MEDTPNQIDSVSNTNENSDGAGEDVITFNILR
jgi:hypothetical protein